MTSMGYVFGANRNHPRGHSMKTITYQAAEREEETVSAFLMMVFEYGREMGLYGLLASRLKIGMKEVKYSRVNKAQTVIASLVMGRGHTKAINETLEPERAAVSYLGLERFPDQSQINRYLTRFSEENVEQLGQIQLEMMVRQSRARHAVGWLVVDIDQCGLVANGKTYEFKRKGYFPRKRGEAGYQLSERISVPTMRRFNCIWIPVIPTVRSGWRICCAIRTAS
jgi:hypothetical protein